MKILFKTEKEIKDFAYNLNKHLKAKGHNIKHSELLDCLSKNQGYQNWNTFSAILKTSSKDPKSKIFNFWNTKNEKEIMDLIFKSDLIQKTNSIWLGKLFSLSIGLFYALCWLRDNKKLILNESVVVKNATLENLSLLSKNSFLPIEKREKINSYLMTIPGVHFGDINNKVAQEQHYFIYEILKKILLDLNNIQKVV